MTRKIPNVDEMFDILSSMNAGKFATICYVNVVKLRKTRKNVDMDAFGNDLDSNRHENDEYWYEPLKRYQQDATIKKNPIYAVISVTRYNLNWSTEDSYNRNYKKFAQKKDEIDKRYGIYKEPEDRRKGGYTSVNTMGISMGNTDNTANKAYIHQNTFNSNTKTTYYVVDENGDVKGEIPYNAIRSLIMTQTPSGVTALRKLQKSEEEIQRYLEEIKGLHFSPRKFLVDKIMYIVATVNHEQIFYINDRLPSEINKINIDSQAFIDKVKQLFNQSYAEVVESYQREQNMIMENKIHDILHENLIKYMNYLN